MGEWPNIKVHDDDDASDLDEAWLVATAALFPNVPEGMRRRIALAMRAAYWLGQGECGCCA